MSDRNRLLGSGGDWEPKVPCELCHDRLGQHGHIVDGRLQYVCCRCWIWTLDKQPVAWHNECPQYHIEKRGKPKVGESLVIIRSGTPMPKRRRRG